MHPLDEAKLKIVWAQKHLDAFKAEAASFLDTKPYRFESEVYGEHWWVKPRLTKSPRPDLTAILGDCISNIRAPFDYVIWELAQKHFSPRVDLARQADRQILAFPILLADPSRRQGHVDHLERLARRGVPTDAIDIIKDSQADVSGDESLRWLYELVNTDKHRTPLFTIGSFSAGQIEIKNYRGQNWLIRSDIINDGVTLHAEPDLIRFVRDNPMNVNVQAAVHITCQDVPMPKEPLERTLAQIIERATNVVSRCERFF